MQFMEPLGATDSSVDASWDWDADDWRKDFVDIVRDLSPDVVRFGGLFSRYYHWREGVGTVSNRPGMRNYVLGARKRTASELMSSSIFAGGLGRRRYIALIS